MPQREFQSKHSQPFVRLGTLESMTTVARKLAIARKAVVEIRDIEIGLLAKGREDSKVFAEKMEWTAHCAKEAGEAMKSAMIILKGMRVDVENYLRDVKNASD